MMARRRPYRRRHPVLTVTAALGLLVLVVLPLLTHLLWLLAAFTVTGIGAYQLGLRHRPVAKASITTADPETAMWKQEAARLQHDLGQAAADRAQLERVILAQRTQLDDLENLTGKTTDELLATYRRVRKQYGPAATGRQP